MTRISLRKAQAVARAEERAEQRLPGKRIGQRKQFATRVALALLRQGATVTEAAELSGQDQRTVTAARVRAGIKSRYALTRERRTEAIGEYAAGETAAEVAARYGLTEATIHTYSSREQGRVKQSRHDNHRMTHPHYYLSSRQFKALMVRGEELLLAIPAEEMPDPLAYARRVLVNVEPDWVRSAELAEIPVSPGQSRGPNEAATLTNTLGEIADPDNLRPDRWYVWHGVILATVSRQSPPRFPVRGLAQWPADVRVGEWRLTGSVSPSGSKK